MEKQRDDGTPGFEEMVDSLLAEREMQRVLKMDGNAINELPVPSEDVWSNILKEIKRNPADPSNSDSLNP